MKTYEQSVVDQIAEYDMNIKDIDDRINQLERERRRLVEGRQNIITYFGNVI